MTNNTITVMKKELARFFGDRRLVITTLLLPGIMIYVVYSFLGSVMMKTMLPEDTYVAKAYVVDMPDSVRDAGTAGGLAAGGQRAADGDTAGDPGETGGWSGGISGGF